MKNNRIRIFDTTLRDGEQCPGASMNLREKLEVARQLARLKVDVIEAGFPVISEGDFAAVQHDRAGNQRPGHLRARALRAARTSMPPARPSSPPASAAASTFSSPLRKSIANSSSAKPERDHPARGRRRETRARSFVDDVEFSPEDASRTEPDFLVEVCKAAIAAGATTINIPDTVGWADARTIRGFDQALVSNRVPNFKRQGNVSASIAITTSAWPSRIHSPPCASGARQVECTVNGIGERAGNAALEEIVMAIKTRGGFFGGFIAA